MTMSKISDEHPMPAHAIIRAVLERQHSLQGNSRDRNSAGGNLLGAGIHWVRI